MALTEIILTRHGKKQKPASDPDTETPLSEEGKIQAFETGKYELARDYSLITVITSPFLRTMQTAERILAGAGYNFNDYRTSKIARTNIGMIKGVSYTNGFLPSGEKTTQDEYIKAILSSYFIKNDKTKPIMARHAHAILDSIAIGTEMQRESLEEDKKGLLLIVSHAGILDAGMNVLCDGLEYHIEGCEGCVKIPEFIGAYQEGEFARGKAEYGEDGTVKYTFDIKGKTVALTDKNLKKKIDVTLTQSREIYQKAV